MSIATMFKKTAATALAVGIIAATNPGTALAWGHTAADKTRNIGALTGVVIAARVLYRSRKPGKNTPQHNIG